MEYRIGEDVFVIHKSRYTNFFHIFKIAKGELFCSYNYFNTILKSESSFDRNRYINKILGTNIKGFSPKSHDPKELVKLIDYCKSIVDNRMVLKSSIFKL